MPRLLLIANPSASGFTGGMFRRVTSTLAERFDLEPAWPESPESARRTAARAAGDGVDIVVAFGGDGVVHHVANGLAETETLLGVIPAGTTNVLARIVGIPQNPRKAAEFLATGYDQRAIRLARIVRDPEDSASYATFAAGIGYDAAVVELADSEPYRKYWFGSVHYARTAARALLRDFRSRKPSITVRSGDRELRAVSVLIQVATPYTYFGRVPLSVGPASPTGLTVAVIQRLPARRALRIITAATRGRDLGTVNDIDVWQGVDELTITTDAPEAAQADGEHLGQSSSFTVTARPAALHIAVPPNPQVN